MAVILKYQIFCTGLGGENLSKKLGDGEDYETPEMRDHYQDCQKQGTRDCVRIILLNI